MRGATDISEGVEGEDFDAVDSGESCVGIFVEEGGDDLARGVGVLVKVSAFSDVVCAFGFCERFFIVCDMADEVEIVDVAESGGFAQSVEQDAAFL